MRPMRKGFLASHQHCYGYLMWIFSRLIRNIIATSCTIETLEVFPRPVQTLGAMFMPSARSKFSRVLVKQRLRNASRPIESLGFISGPIRSLLVSSHPIRKLVDAARPICILGVTLLGIRKLGVASCLIYNSGSRHFELPASNQKVRSYVVSSMKNKRFLASSTISRV